MEEEDGVAENKGLSGAKEREDHKRDRDGAKTGGFMNNLISNWVSKEKEGDKGDDSGESGVKDEGGGLLDHLLTNLVSPKAGRIISEEKDMGESEGFGSDDHVDGSCIGVGERLVNTFKSKFLHQSEGEEVTEKEKESSGEKRRKIVEDDQETTKTSEESGGIIDNIVSHFPKSLPDDAAPTSEEASLLINSFVRD